MDSITEEKRKEFENTVRPVIEWMNNNTHPHCTVIIDSTRAELVEGQCSFVTEDYLVD